MTDYKMTEKLVKVLTEKLLDKCWHEVDREGDSFCKYCGEHYLQIQNRTFTTSDDAHAVMLALKKKGIYGQFYMWAKIKFTSEDRHAYFDEWVWDLWFHSNDERFCALAGRFMEGRK